MSDKKEEARKRLIAALPHISLAAKQAEKAAPSGRVILAVGYENSDKSGQIVARLDLGPFVDDLVLLLGFEKMTDVTRAALEADEQN